MVFSFYSPYTNEYIAQVEKSYPSSKTAYYRSSKTYVNNRQKPQCKFWTHPCVNLQQKRVTLQT